MLNNIGHIEYCNNAVGSFTGYDAAELIDQPFSILSTEEDKTRKRAEYDLSVAVKQGKLEAELWRQRKDGTKFWSCSSISPIYDDQHEHKGYAIIIQDITARKQNEIELIEREERYRLMVDGVKDYSIFMLDVKGFVITWSDGGKKIKGYNQGEILGKHFSVFYTREDLENKKPERELKIATETGKYEEEGWRVRKNGSVFWASIVITALHNDHNEFIGFSKVIRDLSERKKEEEELKQSEERYRLLVEQVRDYGIFMLDEKGRISSWNEGARNIKGYNAEDVIGKNFSIFYTEEDKLINKPANELKIAAKVGKYEEEGWRVKKDGTVFWANVVITSVFNSEGILIGFSKVTRDLTEKKEAENKLRESSERYRFLAEKLKETNTSLAAVNKELEQFTSIVSHDLQEPLRTIKSFLVLLDRGLDTKDIDVVLLKTYIQKAISASNRMKELILNLLQYAQLSKEEIAVEDIDVSELMGEVLQNLKSSIDTAKATISLDIDQRKIKGDRVQLIQLIQNLVSNSLKFTDNKKPEISLTTKYENGAVLFSVADNGIGIEKDMQRQVFEIFRRADNVKEYPGTGIGLSICKKIIERHEGKIWVDSELGKGTTFYFILNHQGFQ